MHSLDLILKEKYAETLVSPSLGKRYQEMLLVAFPTELQNCVYFHDNTFDGSDEIDYINCIEIFKNKKWNEVDFSTLYRKYSQFLMLNNDGMIYYLPAFLNNFFDLKYMNLEYFTYFLSDLNYGFCVPNSDEIEKMVVDRSHKRRRNFSTFERINPIQSKLVAVFLVNVANLLPSDWHEAKQAQSALTNYWGNFLLF